MPRKQTRRAVSVKQETYNRMKAFCEKHERSMSGVVEEAVADFFEEKPPTMYPGSDIPKPKLPPAEKKRVRGGGVHEL
jgi:hypothetical protein